MNLFKPTPCINYNFISSMYAVFSLFGLGLYLLEIFLLEPFKDENPDNGGSSTLKEIAESTEGLYLIFVPFVPCLLWSLVVRREYCRLQDGHQTPASDFSDKDKNKMD